ncbi:MAG: dTDP-4-dehydrorhamnose reductase [Verrucomicrobia bacterium]|nr:dTDP-4-dehydrorhamnose reductase [Verrucomicrobiota bacterium]
MKLVVIGARGMLGRDLVDCCGSRGISVRGYDLPEVDIASGELSALNEADRCDWLINCAAYTDVDGAETDRAKAFAVNCTGAMNLAKWCRMRNMPMLHISTDYIFDGKSQSPYTENDAASPLCVYGESKLAGEEAVMSEAGRYLIVRSQSLFGAYGRNFVRAIMERLQKSDAPLKVVTDQVSCPTWTLHLIEAIQHLMISGRHGVVNVSSSGECSWYEFATQIASKVKPGAVVLPTTAAEYKRAARRPAYSVLDKSRYESWTSRRMPTWPEALGGYLDHLDRLGMKV